MSADPYRARYPLIAPTDQDRKAGAFAAKMAVPQSLTGLGAMAGSAATGGAGYLASILAPFIGAGVGGLAEGNPNTLRDASMAGALSGATKGAFDLGGWLARVTPGGKARIAEMVGRNVEDVACTVNPALGGAIAQAKTGLEPTLRGR